MNLNSFVHSFIHSAGLGMELRASLTLGKCPNPGPTSHFKRQPPVSSGDGRLRLGLGAARSLQVWEPVTRTPPLAVLLGRGEAASQPLQSLVGLEDQEAESAGAGWSWVSRQRLAPTLGTREEPRERRGSPVPGLKGEAVGRRSRGSESSGLSPDTCRRGPSWPCLPRRLPHRTAGPLWRS